MEHFKPEPGCIPSSRHLTEIENFLVIIVKIKAFDRELFRKNLNIDLT